MMGLIGMKKQPDNLSSYVVLWHDIPGFSYFVANNPLFTFLPVTPYTY